MSKNGKKQKDFLVPSPKKPSPGRMAQTPRAVRAASYADFVVIGVQLCSTITAIFPCVALSYKNRSIFRIMWITGDLKRDLRFEFIVQSLKAFGRV